MTCSFFWPGVDFRYVSSESRKTWCLSVRVADDVAQITQRKWRILMVHVSSRREAVAQAEVVSPQPLPALSWDTLSSCCVSAHYTFALSPFVLLFVFASSSKWKEAVMIYSFVSIWNMWQCFCQTRMHSWWVFKHFRTAGVQFYLFDVVQQKRRDTVGGKWPPSPSGFHTYSIAIHLAG